MLRRPLSRPAEIAGLLFEVEAVAERTAWMGVKLGRHTELVNLARRSLAELTAVHDSLERNCTKAHDESLPFELVRSRGQAHVLDLRSGDEAQFDRTYLYGVMALHAELAELLDTQVTPHNAVEEAKERDRLRGTLLAQQQRAQDLLDALE